MKQFSGFSALTRRAFRVLSNILDGDICEKIVSFFQPLTIFAEKPVQNTLLLTITKQSRNQDFRNNLRRRGFQIKTVNYYCKTLRSSHQRWSTKKVLSEIPQNSQENTCARVSFLIQLQAWAAKKETLAQVFSGEFCEISINTSFKEHLRLLNSPSLMFAGFV